MAGMPKRRYRDLVVRLIMSATGWTEEQAINTVGDLTEMQKDGLTALEAAEEILCAAAEDG